MQCNERERRPEHPEHLHVSDLGHAVRIEPVAHAGDGGRIVTARDLVRQHVRRHRAQWKGQEEYCVIGGDRFGAEPLHRRRDHAQTEQVLGERERAAQRPEHRRIPPVRGERDGVRVPPQNPRAQKRIAEVVRHDGGQP